MGEGNPPVKTETTAVRMRINMLAEMLLQGARRSQINAYLANTETWHPDHPSPDPGKVAQRTVDRYLTEARKQITDAAAKKREYLLSKALEQYDDLYYKSYKLQDFRNCRQIIKDRNELTGLLRIESVHNRTETKVDLSKYTAQELIQIMQAGKGELPEQTIDIEFDEMPEAE